MPRRLYRRDSLIESRGKIVVMGDLTEIKREIAYVSVSIHFNSKYV